ncbi:perlucin-like [Aedes albopictus]|uniref:C-type lectin domain-containing protein n=1 Tax=Aedes albopictus TaxID=7160 RepID=A0ABM1ZN37_AEDAL
MIRKICAFLLVVLCGASYDSSKQYVIPCAKASWMGAVEYCTRNNMRLAVITNSAENHLVLDEIHAARANGMKTLRNVWIGASDNLQEGSFIWHETGEPVQFTDWAWRQPDNYARNEDCVEIANRGYTRWTWAWNDYRCTIEQNFVCENYSVPIDIRKPQEQQRQNSLELYPGKI